jgi:hypothetical protein
MTDDSQAQDGGAVPSYGVDVESVGAPESEAA